MAAAAIHAAWRFMTVLLCLYHALDPAIYAQFAASYGGFVPKLVLTYFDYDGSRGEVARLALHLAGIAFEDRRVTWKEWPKLRDKMPFLGMPVLEVDGQVITQSNTINRYVGKLTGLYPRDDWQAALADEVMAAIEDITVEIEETLTLEANAKRKAREALAKGPLLRYLQQIQARLKRGGGEWFVENRLTVADLKCYIWIRALTDGGLDHIPDDFVTSNAPLLAQHMERVSSQPKIAAYYAARGK
jgi:glutathione S-transferase